MDALGCMKSLLLAAAQYRAAKTPCNAALLQRGLEVRAAPGLGPRAAAEAGRRGPEGRRGCRWCPPGLGVAVSGSGPAWLRSAAALCGRSAGSGAAGALAGPAASAAAQRAGPGRVPR